MDILKKAARPPNKVAVLAVRMEQDLMDRFKALAKKYNLPPSAAARTVIKDYMDRNWRKE